jgi:hypothetical protein
MIPTSSPRGIHKSDCPALDVQGELQVLNLDGRDGVEGMRSTKGKSRDLGEFEVFDLPDLREDERPYLIKRWVDEFCHLSDNVFDWGHGVGAAGVVQTGIIDSQHRQGLVEGRTNILRVGLEEQTRLSIGQTKFCDKKIPLRFLVFLNLCGQNAGGNRGG